MNDDLAAKGRAIVEGGKYAPPLGKWLGRIDRWGIDVFENSPKPWQDALYAEYLEEQRRGAQ